jgi:HAD superfamily hydrolase (TIGR01509 family)
MTTIGIDIDNTLVRTEDEITKYKNKYPERCEQQIQEDGTEVTMIKEEYFKDALDYAIKNAKLNPNVIPALNELKEKGYRLVVITARSDNYILAGALKTSQQTLSQYNIPHDKLVTHAGNKVDACIENCVDIMIDDLIKTCEAVNAYGINTIIMNTERNRNKEVEDATRVFDWSEVTQAVEQTLKKPSIMKKTVYKKVI